VKSKAEIEKRLRNLRTKYAKKHIGESQSRCFKNCVYNRVHTNTATYAVSKNVDVPITPRKQTTLLVIQEDSPIHLCMYGSEDLTVWSGDVCNDDSIARSCKYFKPFVSPVQARDDFLESLSDDRYVYDNYRDIATLQWVLHDRLYKMGLSWWERAFLWLKVKLLRVRRPSRSLPVSSLPEDIWDDNNSTPSP